MNLAGWRRRMETALEALREIELGYAQGEQVLGPPGDPAEIGSLAAQAGLKTQSPLLAFYRACSQVSLPDVRNGYFIMPPAFLLRRLGKADQPTRVTGPFEREIVVFGGDGGGGRFALGAGGQGEVLHLGEGAVLDGIFNGTPLNGYDPVEILASDLGAFLERLAADVEAFVRNEADWNYMA